MANTADTRPGQDDRDFIGARGFPGRGSNEIDSTPSPKNDTEPKTILTVTGTAQGLRRLQQLFDEAQAKGEPFKVAGIEVLGITRVGQDKNPQIKNSASSPRQNP